MYKECLQSHCPQRFSLCIDDSIGLCFLQEFTRLPPTAQGQWVSAYGNPKDFFMKVGTGITIGDMIVQYKETDWTFLKRLASHCHSCILPY